MGSDSEQTPPRILVAVENQEVRERLESLLDLSDLSLEVVDPEGDPLRDPRRTKADVLVVRRTEIKEEDLRLVDAFTRNSSKPGLVVMTEPGQDADRARLFAAGASSVLSASDTNMDVRTTIEAIAEAQQGGALDREASHGERDTPSRLSDFISQSPRMRRFLDLVHRVVDTDSSLLLTGETGVGKERLAQAIHNEGPRADLPFVSVNCGAIPEQLLESELFGHEAGAFTGAGKRKKGRFEQANGGTIFLDEIGEMPSHLQVNLLTVLQRRMVQRVGGESTFPIDVRVMAATNRNLSKEVDTGRFRQDLYYRINVVHLNIPALRDRPEDIPELAGRFIHQFREVLGTRKVDSISDEALGALMTYPWPGNVRQLVNAIEHAVVLCRTSEISVDDLPSSILKRPESAVAGRDRPASEGSSAHMSEWLGLELRAARRKVELAFERDYLAALLTETRGVIGETAARAGITPRSLYGKMKRHGLKKESFR